MPISADSLNPARRVGVLVPPSNPVVEPEIRYLLPDHVGVHFARFPVMPNTDLDTRNRAYIDLYAPTFGGFGNIELDAGLVGLTGPSYRLFSQGDKALSPKPCPRWAPAASPWSRPIPPGSPSGPPPIGRITGSPSPRW
jgi:maleate isomerase